MEVFYKSFFLVRAFLRADAAIPQPVDLPDAEDRLISEELAKRAEFPILDVVEALSSMAQPGLIENAAVENHPVNATLSEKEGLRTRETGRQEMLPFGAQSDSVSVTPQPSEATSD